VHNPLLVRSQIFSSQKAVVHTKLSDRLLGGRSRRLPLRGVQKPSDVCSAEKLGIWGIAGMAAQRVRPENISTKKRNNYASATKEFLGV
jgi:hypothetical protein